VKELEFLVTTDTEQYLLYKAGSPGFERSFVRDTIISALMSGSTSMMKEILRFAAVMQGTKIDVFTGEEPGKIFHEYPGVDLSGKNTLYAACDTTALFLIGILAYSKVVIDSQLLTQLRPHIVAAASYIIDHLKDGLFWEDPAKWGSKTGALKVTYWKDSVMLERKDGIPIYPAVFTLAHIQNLAGLRAARQILGTTDYDPYLSEMEEGLHKLFDTVSKQFVVARDQSGDIHAVSDDILHGLYYLRPSDLTNDELESVRKTAALLTTEYGYRTNTADKCDINSKYHSCSLWLFEQGLIHAGAIKFGLDDIASTAIRVTKILEGYHEFCYIDADGVGVEKAGNAPQLWTWAVAEYCKNI
jgi:glycogen debranching enzyme